MSRILLAPFAPAISFNLATFVLFAITTNLGRPLPMKVIVLANYSSLLLAVAGIEADARRRHLTPCFDFGWLVAMSLPISALWYSFRSRGWWGVFLLALIFGLWIAPAFCAVFALALGQQPLEPQD